MREETRSAVVRLPVETVWDCLADYDLVVRLGWDDVSTRRLRPSFRCRARYRVSVLWEGIRHDYLACLERAERPTSLTWSTHSGGAKNWVTFALTPIDESSTRVDVTLHFKAVMSFGSLESTAWELLQPAFIKTMRGLERLHETVGQDAPGRE